jgi:hypothetical protein
LATTESTNRYAPPEIPPPAGGVSTRRCAIEGKKPAGELGGYLAAAGKRRTVTSGNVSSPVPGRKARNQSVSPHDDKIR